MIERDNEGERLRREVERREGSRGRLADDLRRRCEAYAARRVQGGASEESIASELGVSSQSIRRWLRTVETSPAPTAMIPVRIAEPSASTSAVVVTTRGGLRIEGLSIDDICLLAARLG